MTTGNWISLLAITVAAIVAFAVGSLQRKQMRQIELYKKDPSVGLIPPPSALSRFVQSKLDNILGYGGPLVSLIITMFSEGPVTRIDAFLISFSVAIFVSNIVAQMLFRISERTGSVLQLLVDAQANQLKISNRTIEVINRLAVGLGSDKNEA